MKREPFRKIAALAAILSLILSSFIVSGGVTAQAGTSSFAVTSANLTCAEPGDVTALLELEWTGSSALVNAEISISNTSTDWSDTMLTSEADGVSWEFDHHKIDRVVVDATMADGSTWQYQATFFDCGEANPYGEMVTPPTDGSLYFQVIGISWTCDGATTISLDTNQNGEVEVTRSTPAHWSEPAPDGMWVYERSFESTGSGEYNLQFPQQAGSPTTTVFVIEFDGRQYFNDRVLCDTGVPGSYGGGFSGEVYGRTGGVCGHGQAIFRAGSGAKIIIGATYNTSPIMTQLEFVVAPTIGPDDVQIPFFFNANQVGNGDYRVFIRAYDLTTGELFGGNSSIFWKNDCVSLAPLDTDFNIQVKLPEGVSVVGAPFGVYTAEAATLPTGAYYTGIVGANNTITLPDFLPGEYRIVIAPVDGEIISFDVALGEGDTSLVVDLTVDDETTTPGETDSGTTPGETDPGTTPGETDPGTTPTETDPGTESQAAAGQSSSETPGTAVDALPSTGSGSDSSASLIATGSLIALLGMALALRVSGSGGYRR